MLREDLSRNFGFLLNDVARLMRTAYDRRVRKLGLTRAQIKDAFLDAVRWVETVDADVRKAA